MHITLAHTPGFKPPHGVRLRILGKADIPLLVEHLTGLDVGGRRDRFNGTVDSDWIADYAGRCIQPGVMVIAAEYHEHVIGIAEMHPIKRDAVEVAFSVDAHWRGRGVGATLFAMILEAAWSRGLDEIEITTHSQNEAMKRLARKFGAEIRFLDGDSVGRIRLDDIHMLDAGE
ncbi:MAG: GNAT family N-acetyltransferase [Phyllobacteriaceae bacterium]|nr:GNAT family N-acetyltransferase [Phyllobacteriaceae bacterium]